MSIPDKLRSFLNCSSLICAAENKQDFNRRVKKRQNVYRLILEFTFLPQIIAATVIYMYVKGESAVLLDSLTGNMYLAVFLQIFAFSFFTVPKRFYLLRLFPALAYVQLVAAALISGYVNAWLRFFLFAFFGLILCIVNVCALYGWKNLPELKTDNTVNLISDKLNKEE